ncbi:hypothetical protein [Kitasatospora sp. NPDC050543]|uniref:hypothetical protein n=1 Tax=Kitasatospora sp. NPDC050543 TaxID=3364054 RepID=UPI0037ADE603
MTVPNTPPDPGQIPAAEPVAAAGHAPAPGDADPAPYPYGPPSALDPAAFDPAALAPAAKGRRPLLPEARIGVLVVLVCLLLGLVMAALWAWLAPQVPLVVKGNKILYADPEGEQRAGADSVFALLGLGAGVLTALAAFLFTRRRGGGIAVAVGLAVGGLAGSLAAWRVGMHFGPTADVVGHAKRLGDGGAFSDALELGAKGALLVWPMAAMVVLLALSAAFGKREQDPPPYWAGPWPAPAATGTPPAPALADTPPQPADHRPDTPGRGPSGDHLSA